jgi:mannose-6-phosphate isomerase-like protein (cupin superfamily)
LVKVAEPEDSMCREPALLVGVDAVKKDPALQPGARGALKLLVTELYASTEEEATRREWMPASGSSKRPVQVMPSTEVAVFNQFAAQDRHYHKDGTEIYEVLEGKMVIEVEGTPHTLLAGDVVVVNPFAVHEVKPKAGGDGFLCRVITIDCRGESDKYLDGPGRRSNWLNRQECPGSAMGPCGGVGIQVDYAVEEEGTYQAKVTTHYKCMSCGQTWSDWERDWT